MSWPDWSKKIYYSVWGGELESLKISVARVSDFFRLCATAAIKDQVDFYVKRPNTSSCCQEAYIFEIISLMLGANMKFPL